MKRRITGTLKRLKDGHGGGIPARILSTLLIAAMALGLSAPITASAAPSGGTAYLTTGQRIDYDGYFTTLFKSSADGQETHAYCLEADKNTPPSGTYAASNINAPSGRSAEVRTQMWFGFGGPGFDKSMWPSTWYDGSAMNDSKYYVLTHILLSHTYTGDFGRALAGTSEAFQDWVSSNLIGEGHSGVAANDNSVLHQMNRRAGEVPSQDVFDTYELATGNGLQNIGGFAYHPTGWLKLKKASANTSVTDGNRCYSLAGAQFSVTDASGKNVGTLTTDKNGDTNTIELNKGTYTVRETKAPKGYLLSNEAKTVEVKARQTTTVQFADTPGSDPVAMLLGKYDGQKTYNGSGNLPQGSASLAGAQFTVEYYDTLDYSGYDALKKSGEKPKRSWIVRTDEDGYAELSDNYLVSGDALYHMTNGDVTLPRGTVVIYESKAPKGYTANKDVSFQKIQEQPTSAVVTYNAPTVPESVYRSDFEFTKKADETGDRLAGVPFKITSLTTGESHVAVTDENGYFSSASSWNKHTQNTNGNDWALQEQGVIDSGKLDATAGFWFGNNTILAEDGSTTTGDALKADDSLGALPYDSYSIEELRCTNNEGYQLVHTSVTVTRDGKTIDFGTIDDQKASIHTNAYDPTDKDSTIGVGETKVADKVTYTGLIPGRTYKLVAELHDASDGKAVKDEQGNAVTMEKTFVPEQSSGYEVMEITFESCKYAGKTLVVYETVYDEGGSAIAKHTDKDDTDQQADVPEPKVKTKALDGYDGDKNVVADKKVTIVDTVAYSDLTPGTTYKVTGTLHIKKKGDDGKVKDETLKVDGKPVTAEAEFTAEAASGTVDVTFTFDGSAVPDDTTVVAFETISHNGHELAAHAEIEDEDQSVNVKQPSIGTTAKDGVDGDKTVVADTLATLTDEVAYDHVLGNGDTAYTMAGILMDKATGLPILKDGGKFTDDEVSAFMNKLADALGLNKGDSAKRTAKASVAEAKDIDMAALKSLVEKNADLWSQLVWQTSEFTPTSENGSLSMDYKFNANAVIDRANGETKDIVVYEVLVKGSLKNGETPVVVAKECDLKNEDQTVKLVPSSIGTTATDKADGDHTVSNDKKVTIVDTVAYKNLIPGKEYRLTGTLMDKSTKQPLKVDGQTVTAEAKFTPDKADGSADVTFTFDASALGGHDVVVFEELHKRGVDADGKVEDTLVAEHKDIDDEGQTVHVSETPEGSTYGKTGGNAYILPVTVAILCVLAGGAAFYAVRNRRKTEDATDDEE